MEAIIGITAQVNPSKGIWYIDDAYAEGIRQAGGIPLVLPLGIRAPELRTLADMCNGFVFTGGHDISPEVYGEELLPQCGPLAEIRDETEEMLLKRALKDGKPVLGICRGIQLINAVLGGTLYQDLPTQFEGGVEHNQPKPYDRSSHRVAIVENSPLYRLLKKTELQVNSLHHQAVKDLSMYMEAMARSDDGLVEAAYMPSRRFVWAVQWHPEFLLEDPDSKKIFEAFVNACVFRDFVGA